MKELLLFATFLIIIFLFSITEKQQFNEMNRKLSERNRYEFKSCNLRVDKCWLLHTASSRSGIDQQIKDLTKNLMINVKHNTRDICRGEWG